VIIKIQKKYLEQIIKIAQERNKRKIIVYKDLQNVFYGQYMDSITIDQYTSERDTLKEATVEFFNVLSYESSYIRDAGLIPEFVFYTDTGRNNFNRAIVPTWKSERKKALLDQKIKHPLLATSGEYMHDIFKKLNVVIAKVLKYLPNTFYYNLKNIDSDYVPYLHKSLSPKDSLHILVSTDKDYIHMVAEDPDVLRYFFVYKYRRMDTKYNGYKNVSRDKSLSDTEKKILFYNYQVFHGLIGDSSDSVPSLIRGYAIKRWLKILQTKMSENTMNEYRYKMIHNKPFDSLLEKPISSEWDSSLTTVKTYWDIYRLRQIVVDFYFTTIATLPLQLLSPVDLEARNKILPLLTFAESIIKETRNNIITSLDKKDILNINELSSILDYLSVPDSLVKSIYVEESKPEAISKHKMLAVIEN